MKSKPKVYVHRFTGEVQVLRKHHAKKLSEDWSPAEQITNKQGERGMRIQLNGATVDILEDKTPKVVANGERDTK